MIGLRADMDALAMTETGTSAHASEHPGRMHGCGHDGHMAMVLGAAALLTARRDFNGTVRFIFQPAEEHGRGAKAMMADGLFERFPVDAIFGLHNMPGLPLGHFAGRAGGIMAAEDNFEIRITGRGGHAARPHMGVDPLVVAAQIILGLQTIVSRSVDPSAALWCPAQKSRATVFATPSPPPSCCAGIRGATIPRCRPCSRRAHAVPL